MNDFKKQLIKIFSIAILITFVFLSQADAAIQVEAAFSASAEGLSLSYDIPIVGRGNLELEDPGDTGSIDVRILFIKLAEVELSINEITTDPNVINLHYIVSTIFVPVGALEGDISIPFGSAGAVINIMGRTFVPTGDHNIDISFLFTKDSTQYDIQVDLAELIQESFEGEATPTDNQINEQITNPLDGSVLADIDLVLDYPSRFFTTISGDISVCPPSFGGSEDDGDNGNCKHILPPISIPVPNGSYHIWLDLEGIFSE
jgi:hypothetical protein